MELDLQGIISIIIQVIAFFLLLIGVYPSKHREQTKNLVNHGFLSTLAVVMNLTTVFVVMVPVFLNTLSGASINDFAYFPLLWVHFTVGAVTLGSSIIMIASWFLAQLAELRCARRWRLMKPTLVAWGVSIGLGATMHIFGLILVVALLDS